MPDCFVVEACRRVVGVAVRAPGGYRFYSSEPAYFGLEGRVFPRAKLLNQSITMTARAQRRQAESKSRASRMGH